MKNYLEFEKEIKKQDKLFKKELRLNEESSDDEN